MSRSARPKQFLPLTGDTSLFQQTLERVGDAAIYAPAVVLTNGDYRFLVAEQAQEVGAPLAGVLLEPMARNTAAAIAAAAVYVREQFGAGTVIIQPTAVPLASALVGLAAIVVCLVAAAVPARKAARIAPATAFRRVAT